VTEYELARFLRAEATTAFSIMVLVVVKVESSAAEDGRLVVIFTEVGNVPVILIVKEIAMPTKRETILK
jgi:hypothetical protein